MHSVTAAPLLGVVKQKETRMRQDLPVLHFRAPALKAQDLQKTHIKTMQIPLS